MNSENNIQNQNNNLTNNGASIPQQPTMEMFDFGAPATNQTNNLFETPQTQNVASPSNNMVQQPMTQQNIAPTVPVQTPEVTSVQSMPTTPFVENAQPLQPITGVPQMTPQSITPTPSVQPAPTAPAVKEVTPVQSMEQVPSAPPMPSTPVELSTPELDIGSLQMGEMETIPSAPEIAMPEMSTEQVVLDTAKKKQSSDIAIYVVVIAMLVIVIFIDDISKFIQENILHTSPSGVSNATSDNLYEGFIGIGEEQSGITLDKKIRFYNFKKNSDTSEITLNYVTLADIKNIKEKGYYLEIYDSNKNVLYKELFDKEGEQKSGNVGTHTISLDNNVFELAKYALAKTYTEEELNKEITLKCTYKVNNAGYNELYKHNFKFKNDMLVSYDVDKKIDMIDVNNASAKKAKLQIQDEYDKLINAELQVSYENEQLIYSIDLNEVGSNYIPLYKKGTTSSVIKDREKYLKWDCE